MRGPRRLLSEVSRPSVSPRHATGGLAVLVLAFLSAGVFGLVAGAAVIALVVVAVPVARRVSVAPPPVLAALPDPSAAASKALITALGVVALALVGLAVAAPASLLAPLAALLEGVGGVVAIGGVVVAVVVAGWLVWAPAVLGTDVSGADAPADDPVLRTDAGSTGERIDDLLEHVASGAIPWQTGDAVAEVAEAVWTDLRKLAVEAVAERDGCSETVASARVATGEWTDDPYAASFLRDSRKPVLPAHRRVADWLRGRHLTWRIRRTVEAVVAAGNAARAPDVASDGADSGRATPGEPATGGTVETTDPPAVDPPAAAPDGGPGSAGVRRDRRIELDPSERSRGDGADAGLVAGVAAAVAGTALGNAAVLLSAVVGCAYAAYGYAMPDPGTDVRVERRVETASPAPGSDVGVSLTVTNEGDTAIPDLRVVDTPPESLEVVAGETALATSLAAGETAELSYRVRATTGSHRFGATDVTAANVSGTTRFCGAATIDTRLSCDHATDAAPLSDQTTSLEGRVPADSGGTGTEFYATREYHPGDPTNRIDWNRYARTREPTTIEFREHGAAEVLVVLDADSPAADTRRSTTADPATLGRSAGREIVAELLAANNEVGAARINRFDTTALGRRDLIDYLRPLADDLQATRIERLFAVRPDSLRSARDGEPFSGDATGLDRCVRFDHEATDRLVGTLPGETQVIVLTPLLDDGQVDTVVRLLAAGHDVTVAMPDVLPDTPGGRIDGLDRADRIETLRRRGAVVLPWAPEQSLSVALARSTRREVMTA